MNLKESVKSIKGLLPFCEDYLALPHFQRDYVWGKGDVIDFLDSIYKKWPTGLIIIWNTNKNTQGRHFGSYWEQPRDNRKPSALVLDGQQRLTTLKILKDLGYLILKGEHGHREKNYFYFDIDQEVFIANTDSERMDDSGFIDVSDILRNKTLPGFRNKKSKYKNLREMLDYEFPIKYVYPRKSITAIEIFNRVNTAGKKIDNVVLAFAKIKDRYPQIAKEITKFQRECVENGFDLNDRVIMNSFLVVNNITSEEWSPGTRRPDKKVDDYLKSATPKSIKKDLDGVIERIENSLNFLMKNAGFDSDRFLTSDNTIVTLSGYFEVNELGNKLSTRRKNILRKWLYRTILLSRYSTTPDFIQDLRDLYENNRFKGVWDIHESILKDKNEYSSEGLISIMYALGIRNEMKDYDGNKISWFNSRNMKKRVHVDHIYPKSKMASSPIRDEIDKKLTESIGNKAFIVGKENLSKSKKFPRESIHKKDIGQWLNVGHSFFSDDDYKKMKKNPRLLKSNCQEIKEFIENREKKIIKEIKREIGI